HISAMSEKFIKDPRELVKTGNLLQVRVLEVDLERHRIGLSMRTATPPHIENKKDTPQKIGKKIKKEAKNDVFFPQQDATTNHKIEKRNLVPKEHLAKKSKNKIGKKKKEVQKIKAPSNIPLSGAMAEAFSRAFKETSSS
ncbi:hypothetical protein TI03_04805, partial [Achromatium sp. WMS1]